MNLRYYARKLLELFPNINCAYFLYFITYILDLI